MARGRSFKWQDASGNSILLTDFMNGFRVLRGVTGLGLPGFSLDKEPLPDRDSYLVRGVRASGRQIFLPLEVWGTTRQDFLQKKRNLAYMMDPQRGPGYLYITDAGSTYRIPAYYAEGLAGDEGEALAGDDGKGSWVSTGITLDCVSPFFELITPVIIGPYGFSGSIPFFPILPLRLTSSQVLSDASQAAVTNKIVNPSFELNNTTGWSNNFFSDPIVTATPTNLFAASGSFACRVDFNKPNANNDTGSFFTGGDNVALVNGQRYTAKARVWVPSGQPGVRIGTWDGSAASQTNDQWEWVVFSFTASFSTSPLLRLTQDKLGGYNLSNGGYCYIDQAMLVFGPDTQYIDGDQPNCHWNGVPHQSTSYRDPVYAPTLINNPGTKKTFPVIKGVGPFSLLDFVNRGTGEHVTLNYPVPTGQVVTVDMANSLVTLNDGTNLFPYLQADDFWTLGPGDNYISLSLIGAAIGSTVVGSFFPRLDALV